MVPLKLRCSWFALLNTYLASKLNDITLTPFMRGINSIAFGTGKAFQRFNKIIALPISIAGL